MQAVEEIRVSYDHEGCHAEFYRGEQLVSGAYEFAKNYASWEETREAAVQAVKTKVSELLRLGPAPEGETIPL